MTSSSKSELTIVGNRPEPWNELCNYMINHGVKLNHEAIYQSIPTKKVLAFNAPISDKLNQFKFNNEKYESILSEGLFAQESWPLLAELLKDISHEKFESLGSLLQSSDSTETVSVTSAKQRHELKDTMVGFLKKLKVRTTISDRCFLVAEEMLMNAIYDAPTDPYSGKSLYNHMSRKEDILLSSIQTSVFEYGAQGKIAAVAVTDPFGALTKETLIDYLESCYTGRAGEMNEVAGKGGAGRGLHQIVENSDLTVFQVKRGKKTRVVSYFWQKENPFGGNPQLSFTYFD